MVPRTRLAHFALYLSGIEAALFLLQWFLQLAGAGRAAATLGGWITFLAWIVFFLLVFVAVRWFRNHVMWSVRNRLIVTYLFIGGMPRARVTPIAPCSGLGMPGEPATLLSTPVN